MQGLVRIGVSVFGVLLFNISAATLPIKSELVGHGLTKPLFATAPPGDTARLFVVEQGGRIRIIDLATKTVKTTAFVQVTGIISGGEQGLLGLAFHPDYANNGYFYVNYTAPTGGSAGHSEVTRFQVLGDPKTSGIADPASKTVLLKYNQPEANHNGGWVAFGQDGYLYISTGDGGGGDDIHGTIGNGQSRDTLLGKMLRIDVDHGTLYAIPDSNPYKGSTTFKEEIWLFGLRNPWRCSFDSVTGKLWIGDVGQNTREEVDVVAPDGGGLNFGWRVREGKIQNPRYPSEKTVTTAIDPIYDYPHASGNNCVIGGYVYRGQDIPELQGLYIFGDNGSQRFWTMSYDGTNPPQVTEVTALLNPTTNRPVQALSSFGEDARHEVYICDIADGEVYRIVHTSPPAPLIAQPRLSSDGASFLFDFNAAANQGYAVETKSSLDPGATWQPLSDIPAGAAGTRTITNEIHSAEQFFRVRVQ